LIADEIIDDTRHAAALSWHVDPRWKVEVIAANTLRLTETDGTTLWLLHDRGDAALYRGDERSGLGWCAPVYGTLVPTWSVRVTYEATAPFSILTWIGPSADMPRLSRLHTEGESISVRVERDDRSGLFVLRPGTGTPPRLTTAARSGKDLPLVHP
jgi:hypothetical protein